MHGMNVSAQQPRLRALLVDGVQNLQTNMEMGVAQFVGEFNFNLNQSVYGHGYVGIPVEERQAGFFLMQDEVVEYAEDHFKIGGRRIGRSISVSFVFLDGFREPGGAFFYSSSQLSH